MYCERKQTIGLYLGGFLQWWEKREEGLSGSRPNEHPPAFRHCPNSYVASGDRGRIEFKTAGFRDTDVVFAPGLVLYTSFASSPSNLSFILSWSEIRFGKCISGNSQCIILKLPEIKLRLHIRLYPCISWPNPAVEHCENTLPWEDTCYV